MCKILNDFCNVIGQSQISNTQWNPKIIETHSPTDRESVYLTSSEQKHSNCMPTIQYNRLISMPWEINYNWARFTMREREFFILGSACGKDNI